MRLARASILLVTLGTYLAAPFQLTRSEFWSTGLGDWMDPYFINYLLEHWYRNALRLMDPSSPPMFYSARGTLGYSHGLVLYAPFYISARLLSVHPFQGHVASFVILRPNATYAHWVEAPIEIDPSCRAFYIKPASKSYADRPNAAWTVYHLDAMFIALRCQH